MPQLAGALNKLQDRARAANQPRLIERIVLTPAANRGEMDVALHGDPWGPYLNRLEKGRRQEGRPPSSGMSISVVAGVRNHRDRHSLVVSI